MSNEEFTFQEEAIRKLASLLEETGLTEIEYESQKTRIRVARNVTMSVAQATMPAAAILAPATQAQPSSPIPAEKAATDLAHSPGLIKSPMVGTAYLSSQPGTPTFIKLGDSVNEGQTLLIIEAMKVMNPIKAVRAGKVVQICVTDASPVEFGEALIVIE